MVPNDKQHLFKTCLGLLLFEHNQKAPDSWHHLKMIQYNSHLEERPKRMLNLELVLQTLLLA